MEKYYDKPEQYTSALKNSKNIYETKVLTYGRNGPKYKSLSNFIDRCWKSKMSGQDPKIALWTLSTP